MNFFINLKKVSIPKATPMQIYLARTYPNNLQITEYEIVEAGTTEDFITILNSIGYDVEEIPADWNEIYPTQSKVTWAEKKGQRKLLWEQ